MVLLFLWLVMTALSFVHNNKMKFLYLPYFLLCVFILISFSAEAKDYVPKDYIWTSQSKNSSESMPCGGGDIGLNVWVENGDILFYMSKSGMFDENNTLLKAGRMRLRLSPNPFDSYNCKFQQRLCLNDGAIYVEANGVEVRIWADVFSPNIFIELKSDKRQDAVLSYENWRYKDRSVTKAECQQTSYKWLVPNDCVTFADSVRLNGNSLDFWHKNRANTVFDFTVHHEKLDGIRDTLYNPIGNVSFGGKLNAPDFIFVGTSFGKYASTDYKAWNFLARKVSNTTISISLFSGSQPLKPVIASASKKRSSKWWHNYWQRSYVIAEGEASKIVRYYELFRYMLGCNAYGDLPTKFNGSLFTFDPVYVDPKTPFTPDFRKWGGGTMTAQNQRLVYWPMLKSGDVDMMKSQFDTYLRMLPTAETRTKFYWNHAGASFTEQIENFGLPNPAEYGKHKPGDDYGMERNAWLEYQWDTSLEFCSMILQAHNYSGLDISRYERLIYKCLVFFDEHYKYLALKYGVKPLNGEGKLVLYPSSGCETYKMAYNPSSVIAALHTVTDQFESYCKRKVKVSPVLRNATSSNDSLYLSFCKSFKTRIPDIPLRTIGGETCISPAVAWSRVQNVESPQLYPVFPWRIYGLGRPDIDIAINTYFKDSHVVSMRSSKGWKQDNIWAACLGLTDEAVKLNKEKFADGPYRFPVFYDPGFDWAPDCNKGGSAMIGLQEMLLQETPDGKLLLFPAWRNDWDAKFRLHATGGRIVDAEINNGLIKSSVTKYLPK